MTQPGKRQSARERLLAASDELFYSEGIHSVGIDRVLEKANVAKGSLYYNFAGGKDELIEAYLAGRHGVWKEKVEHGIAEHTDPVERILAVFESLRELFSRPDFRGCAFVNATAEARPDSVEMLAAGRFRTWVHALFSSLATESRVADPDRLARQLVVLYDGATTTAQMDSTADAAATAADMARMLLQQAPVLA